MFMKLSVCTSAKEISIAHTYIHFTSIACFVLVLFTVAYVFYKLYYLPLTMVTIKS